MTIRPRHVGARSVATVAVLVVGLAACSTTGSENAAGDGAFTTDPALAIAETTIPAATPTTGASTAGASGPASTTAVATAPTFAGEPSTPSSVAVGAAANAPTCGRTGGQGVTPSTISLGFMHSSDVGQANRSIGGNQWREGEPKSFGDAYIRWFNKTGGLCGRKIVPVWIDEKTVTGASPDANDQAACTALTQDNKVFAAMSMGTFRPNRLACLTRAGVIALDVSSLLTSDAEEARQHFDHFYQPYKFTLDRFLPIYVDQLVKANYFDKGARVGLLYTDVPAEERAIKRVLIPALQARGITVADQARVTHTYGIDSFAAAQAQTNNAVLSFQTRGVTHVLAPIDSYSFGSFIGRADQQGYKPRYGISFSATSGIRGGYGMAQSEQFDGAVMVTWAPALSPNEAWATPGTKQCLDILKQEGHPAPNDFGTLSLTYCDFLTFMRVVLDGAADITVPGFHRAATSLQRQTTGYGWSWRLAPNRHDGGDSIRVATYTGGDKGRWRYITPLTQVG